MSIYQKLTLSLLAKAVGATIFIIGLGEIDPRMLLFGGVLVVGSLWLDVSIFKKP